MKLCGKTEEEKEKWARKEGERRKGNKNRYKGVRKCLKKK